MDTLRPRSDAKRGSGAWLCTRPARESNAERPGTKKRSSARVFRWGDRPLEAAVRGAAVLRAGHRTARGKRRRSSAQGWQSPVWGSCGRRGSGQPSVHPDADGRDLRPARVEATAQLSEAEPQAHRTGRSAGPVCNRQAHSDQGVEDEAQGALRPRCPAGEAINSNRRTCPAGEAINSNRRTGVQRKKGLSLQPPDVSRGRRAYHSNPLDEAANEGLITPSIGPCCLRRAYHSAAAAFPRGPPFRSDPG